VIIRTYISANKLNAIPTYEWKNSVYMVITMSMSMTYIQAIYTAYSAILSLNPISPLTHASFLTYEILVHLKTSVSNKRHLVTTLTRRAAYSANHKRARRCKCE